jgi:hypothetical protein
VQADQLVDERQADAAALVAASLCAADAVEAVEQPRQLLRRDADAAVGDLEHGRLPDADAEGDPPLEGELVGVGEQVEQDLLEHVRVGLDDRALLRRVDDELEPGALDRGLKHGSGVAGEAAEVDGPVGGRLVAGLDPGEVEQGVDQSQQP